jgi:hydrogenase maturation protein HypF
MRRTSSSVASVGLAAELARPDPLTHVRRRVRVAGTVQGVGFRPYVYRLAGSLALAGWVLNDSQGVLVEVEGPPPALDSFLERLTAEAPPLASLERVEVDELDARGERGFRIRESPRGGTPDAPVAPDSATCEACLAELFDSTDRRHRYPFINCTNCGPRFTIVTGVPYDRPSTTMAGFPMCDDCRAEYEDPGDRRFHAQPNACPACGPRARLLDSSGAPAPEPAGAPPPDAVAAAAIALRDGAIVAVKGVGGYHLACRADDAAAVAALRARKHREDKPFALMVSSVAGAEARVRLGPRERELLESPARPIVLAPRRPGAEVAAEVAPRAAELGVMLPYAPLHHVLMADLAGVGVDAIVLTSGNVSEEPIAFGDADAAERLAAIVDLFLVHDRPIATRTDDSVLRVTPGPGGSQRPLFLRRSRGYVPEALGLPGGAPVAVLGCGAELKSTFCVAKGERAWVSHHIGDLQNLETLRSFTDGIAHFEELFAVTPRVLAHDLHPEYLSSKYAAERDGVELIAVQHHHAHLAACLAEHGLDGPALGAIFDGTGLGTDATIWGGELLLGDLVRCTRVGRLAPTRLPGGEMAIREPWRMACAWLTELAAAVPEIPPTLAGVVTPTRWEQVARLVLTGFQAPVTTSVGRLCDAASALCGVRPSASYEGQAAIELEAISAAEPVDPYPVALASDADGLVLDPRPALRALLADQVRGTPAPMLGARFHAALGELTCRGLEAAASAHGVETVVLSGGVWANRRLLVSVSSRLRDRGLRVLIPERLPVGDGGISFGQVAIAAARLRERA